MSPLGKQVSYCTIGTVLEWYDFSLFVYLTPIISTLFFPHTNHFSALLSTLAIFATGYLMRPLGALFFGHLGDTLGRKSTLLITIFLMAIATTAIGLIPTGTSFSMELLIIARLAQGFATSGEFPGGLTLLAEQNHQMHKGFVSSFGIFSTGMGIFLGALVYAINLKFFGFDTMLKWAWRIPFLLGAPLGILGYLLRRSVLESSKFTALKQENSLQRTPLIYLFKHHYKILIAALCLYIPCNILVYINLAYLGNYALAAHKLTASQLMNLNLLITITYSISILIFGFISDYCNRKVLLITACLLIIFLTYPLLHLALIGTLAQQFFAQIMIALLLGVFLGPCANISAESFPVAIRYSGLSITVNISASVFGGTAPLVCTWLAQWTSSIFSAAYYVIFFAVLALIACYFIFTQMAENPIPEREQAGQ